MRTVPLQQRLFLLAAAAIVPLAAMSGVALLAVARQHQIQIERSALEVTRALATAVDGELRRSIAVLEALAISPSLDSGDLKRFYGATQRVLESRPTWYTVILVHPSGRQLINARRPFGAELPPLVEKESFERLLETRRPVIGYLAAGPEGVRVVPIRVPVIRNGELRYVLTAAVKPDGVLDVINRQRVPQDWVISVFDGKGMRVARSRAHQQFLGTAAAPSLREQMASGEAEGAGMTRTLEGDAVYSAYSRLADSGWSVAIGIPRSVVNTGVYGAVAVYAAGLLASIAIAVIAALFIARGIARPIGELRNAAQALGRRESLALPATPIAEIRQVSESLAFAADERARGDAEREQLLVREQDARSAAETASRAKDEFLAMLSHELRNPLGAIANASRLLTHPGADPATAQYAREIIMRQVEHLTRLTDDLLDAGRAIMGKIVLQRASLDLAETVRRTLGTLKASLRTEQHRFLLALEPAWVDADETRIEQIISNLVINAVKFTPGGGEIRLATRREAGHSVLSVADNGIGLAPELAAHVFELFVQGDRALDRAHGGLGIGLTLVRRLAELHGGSANVYSAGPGQGSEFTVRLPAVASPAARAAHPGVGAAKAPRHIMIIEDNDDARETLRRLLELAGHRVQVAKDGASGLAAALASRPEVVLIDVGLPRIDGFELARRIRAAGGSAWRPYLVAVTGYGQPEDRGRALAAGFDEHLVKPIDDTVLEKVLPAADEGGEARHL